MGTKQIYSDYDRFAWFYNKYWGEEFSRPALSIFNIILVPHLPVGANVLDLCCGTGQIAAGLSERGLNVTGLDGSEAMLRFARANAPEIEFIHGDARSFELPGVFHAVISPFDSLNHLMKFDELKQVFSNVHRVLLDDGIFLFDLNLEDESEMIGNSINMVGADHACVVNATYDPVEKLKRYDVTMFRKEEGKWERSDLTLLQRYYDSAQVIAALVEAGFSSIKTYDARREFGMTLSDGRMFYFARKRE
jgi:SAM-dependent methyltransferase